MDFEGILVNALRSATGRDAVVYALLAIGLNLHFGYTGLLNFGQVGFMAVGAYGVGISVTYFGLPLFVGVVVGILAAVVLALLLGLPTLRLRADYLAIVTIASGEIIRFLFRSVTLRNYTGGSNGLSQFADGFYRVSPIPPGTYGLPYLRYDERAFWLLIVAWTLVVLMTGLVFLLMRSPWGRVLKAIREDEDAARSLGKNVYSYKMQSLILGGVIGALAGMVFVIDSQAIQPDSFSTPVTFFAYAALILGGAATILGPVFGAMVFWALLSLSETLIRQAVLAGYVPAALMDTSQVGQVRFMLVGLFLMSLMIFRPQGIFGDKQEIALDV